MNPDEKYCTDPIYHRVVDLLMSIIGEAKLTPSEVREAAAFACTRYEMLTVRKYLIPREGLELKEEGK